MWIEIIGDVPLPLRRCSATPLRLLAEDFEGAIGAFGSGGLEADVGTLVDDDLFGFGGGEGDVCAVIISEGGPGGIVVADLEGDGSGEGGGGDDEQGGRLLQLIRFEDIGEGLAGRDDHVGDGDDFEAGYFGVGEEAFVAGYFPGIISNINKIALGDFVAEVAHDKEHAGVFDLEVAELVAAVGGAKGMVEGDGGGDQLAFGVFEDYTAGDGTGGEF